MKLMKPTKLQPGATIGIVSPSSPTASHCPLRFQRGVDLLTSMGFNVVIGKHALKRTAYTAGTVEERLEDLHEMFRNPAVSAIIATIGGYSSHQLLEGLDYSLIEKNPKILIGYSDITALLTAVFQKTGLVTYMGPALLPQFGECGGLLPYTHASFQRVLMNDTPIGQVDPSLEWTDEFLFWDRDDVRPREQKPNPGVRVLRAGNARGPLLAGNMGVLLLLAGTPYFPDLRGAILCLEDDDSEKPETIDRYLTQFRQMGVFNQIAGLLVGRFHPNVGLSDNRLLEDMLVRTTAGTQFPIVYDVDFGHTDPMMVLPNGLMATLDADGASPRFVIEEAAVRSSSNTDEKVSDER